MRRILSVFICVYLWLSFSSPAPAHPARMASGVATISPEGAYRVRLTIDVLAYALNDTTERVGDAEMNRLLDGPDSDLRSALDDARDRLANAVKVTTDRGPGTTDRATVPIPAQIKSDAAARPRDLRLPVSLEVSVEGHLPAGATSVRFRLPEILGTIVLTVERPGEEPVAIAMEPGRESEDVPITLKTDAATRPAAPHPGPRSPSWLKTLLDFIALGFRHIVPEGTDHILFVLGLFLLSANLRPLLWQVTAFTVAHSITLALSWYGVVRLPSSVVEPLIALSISFVAVENLFTSKLHPWRPAVVFGFGLIHGMGFAGVLASLSLPRSQYVPALIGFNFGVECGQLSVIAAAFLLIGWFRHRPWYRPALTIPASLAIAAIGLFWTVQRIFLP